MPSSLLALVAIAMLALAPLSSSGRGATIQVRLCGSGLTIDIPVGKNHRPAPEKDKPCALACHAACDGRRRSSRA